MEKCLVKEKGKKCTRPKHCRGQCLLHYKHFGIQVRNGRMTWEFLELAGEAEPFETDRDKDAKRGKVSRTETTSRKVGKREGASSRSKKPNNGNPKKGVQSKNSDPSKKVAKKTEKGKSR